MRFWFDTEFIDDGKTIELISIGAVAEDGRCFYTESSDCDLSRAGDWVKRNVLPHLTGAGVPRDIIARQLVAFFGDKPELWAYYGAYDWVALCQLFGPMNDLPLGWPDYCRDVKQLADHLGRRDLPPQPEQQHNALADAIWTKGAWQALQRK